MPKRPAQTARQTELESLRPELMRCAVMLTRDPSVAEDLVQRTYEKALAGSRDIFTLDNPLGWMKTVLRNLFIDDKRRQATYRRVVADETDAAQISGRDRVVPQHPLRMELREVLRSISPDMAQALLLVVVEGFTYAEVAETQGVAVGTVKSRVSRAREALAARLRSADGSR